MGTDFRWTIIAALLAAATAQTTSFDGRQVRQTQAPANDPNNFSVFVRALPPHANVPATTPQPLAQSFPRPQQSFSVSSSSSSEDALRQGKIVGSIQPPAQVIQKSPASEIQQSKQPEAKDKAAKDNAKDEYVVYYYYYYDDDNKKTTCRKVVASPNPQHRFEPKTVTAIPPAGQQQAPPAFPLEQAVTSAPQTVTQVSVSVSVSEGTHPLLPSQPFEAKRPPVVGPPNLDFTGAVLVPEGGAGVPSESRSGSTLQTPGVSTVASAETQGANEIIGKKAPDTSVVETTTTTTTTTTTEPPTTLPPTTTTTEEPTTTEKSRRHFGNRRRFGGPHGRAHPPGRKAHTTSTTTTTATPSTRRTIGGLRRNRPSPRPAAGGRLQFGRRPSPIHSRNHKEEEPEEEESAAEHEPTTIAPATTTAGGKKRFGGPSRFGGAKANGRTRGSGSTPSPASSTTAGHRRPGGPRPGGGLFNRSNRGPRPRTPFSRHRPGAKKVEEEHKAEETEESPVTTPETKEEASASASTEAASKHEETAASESEPASEEVHATEAPAVTPESKPGRRPFGSRPRPALFGGRPRPHLGR
ncbi:hypothetical protein IscW_ISCW004728 [Ixodes scapularis]|uniref:Mucin-5AC n=1 Tax=Ixodes scapularis TaxID=6945 RepID=B7PIQ0_IXOSC|nr:hypothetical protein IscW_ISCW004728 [Ixodes scapularis]|eukprot:XP_002405798.1 hypothetical protein IscW_ISCW004728 [Ixodes scapularis]